MQLINYNELTETDRQALERHYMAMRRNALSLVRQAEVALHAIGRPLPSAIKTREERRDDRHKTYAS